MTFRQEASNFAGYTGTKLADIVGSYLGKFRFASGRMLCVESLGGGTRAWWKDSKEPIHNGPGWPAFSLAEMVEETELATKRVLAAACGEGGAKPASLKWLPGDYELAHRVEDQLRVQALCWMVNNPGGDPKSLLAVAALTSAYIEYPRYCA